MSGRETGDPGLPAVSVVMPCYNAAEFVEATIGSVFDQAFAAEQVICIDDGSSDATLGVLRGLRDSGLSITVLSQSNKGPNAARNVGLERVRSEYVQFLDADDLLHPMKLEHQANLVAASPFRPGFVAGGYERVDEDGGTRGRMVKALPETGDDWAELFCSGLGITSSNLWRADEVRAVGGWNEDATASDDSELMFRMLKNGATVLRDPVVYTTLRRRSNSRSNHNRLHSNRQWLGLRREMWAYMDTNGLLSPDFESVLQERAFSVMRKIYPLDPGYAVAAHDQLIRRGFRPNASGLNSRVYRLLYRTLGFWRAERLRSVWLRLGKLGLERNP